MMMKSDNIYSKKIIWKISLLSFAFAISVASLFYTNYIVQKLSKEEEKKVNLLAEAFRKLSSPLNLGMDVSFVLEIIKQNTTIPVILTDDQDQILNWKNIDSTKVKADPNYLIQVLNEMKQQNEPIVVEVSADQNQYIYYKNSILVDALKYYPWAQLTLIALFMFLSYLAFSAARNAEQNQVWVGMAKETAHQLGTPLSSLYGWTAFLRTQGVDEQVLDEMERDVNRLNVISDRFSKIGSAPNLQEENLAEVLENAVNYMRKRLSTNTNLILLNDLPLEAKVLLTKPLFDWVLENILKNAVDAMEGSGTITVSCFVAQDNYVIDIKDDGKGIAKRVVKQIFKPGFTSKKRGWGLGLSLAKRIVESYHKGKIFVLNSELNKGSTFRIMLPIPS